MIFPGAAVSFISLPSPKGNPFRGGPKKDKKSRSLKKAFSPIRRLGRQLSQRPSLNTKKNKAKDQASERLLSTDEQGWIAPSTTFETEDTLSPKSFDSIITNDSTSMPEETGEKKNDMMLCSVLDSSQQIDIDEYIDLEVGFSESANAAMVSDCEDDDVQECTEEIELNERTMEQCEAEYAAPPVITPTKDDLNNDVKEEGGIQYSPSQDLDDDKFSDDQEDSKHSMMSLLSRIDTTEVIDEADEIDSLAPAADISFFLNEEKGHDFHCVGRISTPQKYREPPVQIDVDSIDDRSNSSPSIADNASRGLYIEDDEDFSLSSYNSYMQAIGSITSSANRKMEGAFSIAMNDVAGQTPPFIPVALDSDSEPELDSDDEDDYLCVSFNPSQELLLQAMEGASAKAKADIERATALALSKMNSAKSTTSKEKPSSTPNLILGFLCVILLFFQLNGNASPILQGIKSFSHSVGIDEFQILARNSESVHGTWGNQQMLAKRNDTYDTVNKGRFYNIGCSSKVACLALGSI